MQEWGKVGDNNFIHPSKVIYMVFKTKVKYMLLPCFKIKPLPNKSESWQEWRLLLLFGLKRPCTQGTVFVSFVFPFGT